MDSQHQPTDIYHQQIEDLGKQLNQLKGKKNSISWARFAVVVTAIILIYNFREAGLFTIVVITIIMLAIFSRLVMMGATNKAAIENTNRLIAINQLELNVAAGHYSQLPNGLSHLPEVHEYANDLDILGKSSLFQYMNRTTSEPGEDVLAKWLLYPSDAAAIIERQDAAKELSGHYQWRQQFQAYGMASSIRRTTDAKLCGWATTENEFVTKPYWLWLRFLLPAILFIAWFLYLDNQIQLGIFSFILLFSVSVAGMISKKITPHYKQVNKMAEEIRTLYNSIEWIEQQPFECVLLKKHQHLFVTAHSKASSEVKALKFILDKFDFRVNPMVFIPVNTLLQWDLQQIIALERWKEKNKAYITHWIKTLAEMEALATLANLHFNHPLWSFPTLDAKQHGTFESTGLGHPLIPAAKLVYNDFSTQGQGQIALITGSNMAGKSTFLRSVGVNVVLAMMGAPVCADSLRLSPMRLVSSMRIADNLKESTSTFYAELKKLKTIIELVNQHEKVFILLDEILRGTNSLDRYIGSKALVKQLIKKDAVALLATHDVELAKIEEEYPTHIGNYHFDAQIENEELYFDYKLKEGVCKSLNASILMKKIGIEM